MFSGSGSLGPFHNDEWATYLCSIPNVRPIITRSILYTLQYLSTFHLPIIHLSLNTESRIPLIKKCKSITTLKFQHKTMNLCFCNEINYILCDWIFITEQIELGIITGESVVYRSWSIVAVLRWQCGKLLSVNSLGGMWSRCKVSRWYSAFRWKGWMATSSFWRMHSCSEFTYVFLSYALIKLGLHIHVDIFSEYWREK